MSVTRRNRGPSDHVPYVAAAAAITLVVAMLGVWVAVTAGNLLAHRPPPTGNPFAVAVNVATGRIPWPGPAATLIAIAELLGVAALVVLGWRTVRRARHPRLPVDAAARHLATGRDIAPLTGKAMAAIAHRLGVPEPASPGVPIGRALPGKERIYGSWEDMHLDIWGTRTGKTTSRAIPAILAAPGCTLVTSNKRDVVDATRGIREHGGKSTVWVFDPHQIAGEEATWWWNPLSYVVDVDRAMRLGALLAGFSRTVDAKQDAYFDPMGEQLLSFMLLAAAAASEPITTVHRWLADPTNTTPVDHLRRAGHQLPADTVQGVINYADKQRDGIYGTAAKAVSWLVNPTVTQWITPDPRTRRPEFDPHAFVESTDTLYSLSMEGRSGAAIVAALNVACIEAAEEYSTRSAGGRLRRPFLGVLDEAANGVRWRDLPDRYSHYGSRGIILMTILQSWSQGVEVWGEHGMRKLRDAANIRLYGGGSLDHQFLADLSHLVGQFEPQTHSLSVQRGTMASHSVSTQTRPEDILDVADLAALPRGRALVFASGMRPVLVQTEPWTRSPHRTAVEASIRRYGPTGDIPAIDETGEAPDARPR